MVNKNVDKMKSRKAQGMKSKVSPASPFVKKAQMKNKKIFQLLHKKNGQMKIQQMSFMLLAVFLFFALVGMIIITVKMSEIKDSATELKRQNAMLLATKLANSPEFSCGGAYGTSEKIACIDEDKVMMLKENIDTYIDKNTNFWGVSGIEIRRIYPKWTLAKDKECIEGNYPNCNIITLIDIKGYDRSNFVALCIKEIYKD